MAAPMKRVIAWRNRDEWGAVYSDLFSSSEADKRHAIHCIAMWKSRVLHRLAAAIECTWQLVNAQLQDACFHREGALPENDQELRMMYSVAVIRFINLLTEKGQTRMYAQPVHRLAETLGLPEWIVDIRHEATHSHLPSLPILQAAGAFALSWLKREYWEAQTGADLVSGSQSPMRSAPVRKIVSQEKIYEAIQKYKAIRDQTVMPGSTKESKKHQSQILADIEQIYCYGENKDAVVNTLIEKGHLLQTDRQLQSFKSSQDDHESSRILPQSLIDYWSPLLNKLHNFDCFLHRLLTKLSCTLTEEGSERDKIVLGWISTLVTANYNASHLDDSRNFLKKGCELDLKPIIKVCIERPNKGTAQFLKSLAHILEASEIYNNRQIEKLSTLARLYTPPQANTQGENEEVVVSTIDTLKQSDTSDQNMSEESEQINEGVMDTSEESLWHFAPEFLDWSHVAIGSNPDGTSSLYDLELPDLVNHVGRTTPTSTTTLRREVKGEMTNQDVMTINNWSQEQEARISNNIRLL